MRVTLHTLPSTAATAPPGDGYRCAVAGTSGRRKESDVAELGDPGSRGGLRAGVEMGGTKVVVGFGTGPDDLHDVRRIPTTTPGETLGSVADLLRSAAPAAVGVASFGPAEVRPGAAGYGRVLATPKPGWAGADVVGTLSAAVPGVPIVFDTDVVGAAAGEARWGAGRGLTGGTLLYLTVGTGIGGGVWPRAAGQHAEMGHIPVPHDRSADPFPGRCPFHGDCWEGLASGPAMRERWGVPAEELPPDHAAWRLAAEYLAAGLQALVLTLAPARVVVGGGVAAAPGLLPSVRTRLLSRVAGYLAWPELTPEGIDEYVVAPVLGDRAGVLGAIALTLTRGVA
jgi:fructokinase